MEETGPKRKAINSSVVEIVRAFCITLPELPERLAEANKHFLEMGVDCEPFHGINAMKFGLMTSHVYDVDHPHSGDRINAKHVGLHLSHYMLWTTLSFLHGDFFMVLEDDVNFAADWRKRMATAVASAPDNWDMIFLGSCNCAHKPQTKVGEDLFIINWPQCTHCYLVRQKALKVLLETQRDSWAPIDLALIFRSFPRLNVYTVLPRIADQRGQQLGE